MGQALWVSITSCAAVIAILKPESETLNIYGYIGIMIWILGFTLEVIADLHAKFGDKILEIDIKGLQSEQNGVMHG